jgi:hydrogenase maturation protease
MDDGLGPAMAACLESLSLRGVSVESDYQLTIELSHQVAQYDVIIFVDADANCSAPFFFRKLVPGAVTAASSHDVEPEEVLTLAQMLFGATTQAYVLGIRGYQFNNFNENITGRARKNLAAALQFLLGLLKNGNFEQAAEGFVPRRAKRYEPDLHKICLN